MPTPIRSCVRLLALLILAGWIAAADDTKGVLAGVSSPIQLITEGSPKDKITFSASTLSLGMLPGAKIPYTTSGGKKKTSFSGSVVDGQGNKVEISGRVEKINKKDFITGHLLLTPKKGEAKTINFKTVVEEKEKK